MKFTFSLQAVLDHRLTVEDKLRREYGEALSRLQAVSRRRRQVQNDAVRCVNEIRQRMRAGQPFAEREIYERWIEACREQIEALMKEEEHLAAIVEQHRQRLLKAVQDRTIMEKLCERERAAFLLEEARGELKFFDAVAVRDYVITRRQAKDADLAERIAR